MCCRCHLSQQGACAVSKVQFSANSFYSIVTMFWVWNSKHNKFLRNREVPVLYNPVHIITNPVWNTISDVSERELLRTRIQDVLNFTCNVTPSAKTRNVRQSKVYQRPKDYLLKYSFSLGSLFEVFLCISFSISCVNFELHLESNEVLQPFSYRRRLRIHKTSFSNVKDIST